MGDKGLRVECCGHCGRPLNVLAPCPCEFTEVIMAKRHSMNRRSSEKYFTRTAGSNRVHPKNMLSQVQGPGPMRGGIRL